MPAAAPHPFPAPPALEAGSRGTRLGSTADRRRRPRRSAVAAALLSGALLTGCGVAAGDGGTGPRSADHGAHGGHEAGDDSPTGDGQSGTDEAAGAGDGADEGDGHGDHEGSGGDDEAAEGATGGDGEHGDGEHGDVTHTMPDGFAEALDRVSTGRGREILDDGLITGAELQDLERARVECLAEDGYDADLVEGELQIRRAPEGADEDRVAQDVQACLGDLEVIAPLAVQGAGPA